MNKPKEKAFPDFMEMTRHGNTMILEVWHCQRRVDEVYRAFTSDALAAISPCRWYLKV